MADYVPVLQDGDSFTLAASATITAGQVLAVTGSGTVGPAGAAAVNWVGVAGFDAVSGDQVTLYRDGWQTCTASGTIAAGDLVICAAAGAVATNATPPLNQLVGIALTAATNGNKVRVHFAR